MSLTRLLNGQGSDEINLQGASYRKRDDGSFLVPQHVADAILSDGKSGFFKAPPNYAGPAGAATCGLAHTIERRNQRFVVFDCLSPSEPRNRAVAYVVGPGDVAHRLAVPVAPPDRLAHLVEREFGLPSHFHALRLRASPPSPVRARIRSRSNSAKPPRTVSISRPCAVAVSAHASPRDRKPAPRSAMNARVLRRSRVDRARRSSLVTHQHVARVEIVQNAAQACPVWFRAGCRLADDLFSPAA